ncbi:hypothetical protein PHLCEN_2v6277 [Hermanssonia centrifuga]|uniref:Uncharacterized protein n=1 Tax=Hermanssonia centrifuga TaxID=98765 RepID=A0A2R6NZZ2_9APHY|nr:hypothetical protein PHLCEN_2v6277 [Hermanssonia centrifuga]
MATIADIFAQTLSKVTMGRAMWSPEPTEGPDGLISKVCIGDVGYIDEDGAFHRLFNATLGIDHLSNSSGVPEDFVPLRIDIHTSQVDDALLITSRGVA